MVAMFGLMLPGGRCELCGAVLLLAALTTPTGRRFCASHQDLPKCHQCSAVFTGAGRFCGQCAATSVDTQERVRQVLPQIRGALKAMGLHLNPPVHVQLVDEAKMQGLSRDEPGVVNGLTMANGRQVVEVLVTAGQPELEFGVTVVHEVMHAWLAQNGFGQLDPMVEEGLCEVVSYRWLRDQPGPLANWLRQKLDMNPDPVYGNGFRAAKESVRRLGMNEVIAFVKAHGRLP